MQMPGGRKDSVSGYATIGHNARPTGHKAPTEFSRVGSERRSREQTRTPSQSNTSSSGRNSSDKPSASVSKPVAAPDDSSPTKTTPERSRSRLSKFFDSVSKSLTPRRSQSAGPNTRLSASAAQSQLAASPSNPDLLSSNRVAAVQSTVEPDRALEPLTNGKAYENLQFSSGRIPGAVGIVNHGNTCFMNAIIQCLSNTEYFAEYFITDQYRTDTLAAQRAGRSCSLTEQFAQLITSLWTCEYNVQQSSYFRYLISTLAVQYSDSEQNDAQEFLQWLLDYMNEELCGDANLQVGRGTASVNAQKINGGGVDSDSAFSIINDLFLAQFQSTITCPRCSHHSSKLDPFFFLPLPISEKYKMPVYPIVVRCNASPNLLRIGILSSTAETVVDLRNKISLQSAVPPEEMILVQVAQNFSFVQTLHNCQLMSDVECEFASVFAVQVPPVRSSSGPVISIIAVNIAITSKEAKRFGCPFVVHVSRDLLNSELRYSLLSAMKDMFTDTAVTQLNKLTWAFQLRLFREQEDDFVIPQDVEIPLYLTEIDDALSCCDYDKGPRHIKLTLEWDDADYKRWVSNRRPIPVDDVSVKQVKSESRHLSAASLDDCIRDFTQQERLGAGEKWYCTACKRHRTGAVKSLSLSSLPDVMIIQLKRFQQESENRTKINAFIQYPLENLDMSSHLEKQQSENRASPKREECIYDLYAVCNHIGTLQGGHYTAICKNPVNGQWLRFDDEKVSIIQKDYRIVTKDAYLLFYRRRAATSRSTVSLHQQIRAICSAIGSAPAQPEKWRQQQRLQYSTQSRPTPQHQANQSHAVSRSSTASVNGSSSRRYSSGHGYSQAHPASSGVMSYEARQAIIRARQLKFKKKMAALDQTQSSMEEPPTRRHQPVTSSQSVPHGRGRTSAVTHQIPRDSSRDISPAAPAQEPLPPLPPRQPVSRRTYPAVPAPVNSDSNVSTSTSVTTCRSSETLTSSASDSVESGVQNARSALSAAAAANVSLVDSSAASACNSRSALNSSSVIGYRRVPARTNPAMVFVRVDPTTGQIMQPANGSRFTVESGV